MKTVQSGIRAREIALLWALALLPLSVGCGTAAGPAAEALPGNGSPAAAAVIRGDFTRELLLTGELQSVRSIEIKAPQTNIFQMRIQFMAEEGSVVRAGDPLLDFDNSALAEQVRDLESRILDAEIQIANKDSELKSALKDLEIELAQREFDFERTRLEASVDPEVLSRKEHAERQLALTKATRELQETRDRIALTQRRGQAELDVLTIERDKLKQDMLAARDGVELLSIRAPAEGLVVYERRQGTTLRYQEGDSCWPGQAVIRLPDLSEMQVVFFVNEVDAPQLRTGMPVRVTLDAFPGRALTGEILSVPSMAVKRDETSKVAVFKVTASLSETWAGEMKPGMSALGRIVIDRMDDVPLVARERVRFDGEHYWLERVAADGSRGEAQRIDPLSRNERFYVVSEDEFARLTGAAPRDGARPAAAGVPS